LISCLTVTLYAAEKHLLIGTPTHNADAKKARQYNAVLPPVHPIGHKPKSHLERALFLRGNNSGASFNSKIE
jgi:hypothetical protein